MDAPTNPRVLFFSVFMILAVINIVTGMVIERAFEVVNQDRPDIWKQRNRNFEMWMLDQKSKEIAQINAKVNA